MINVLADESETLASRPESWWFELQPLQKGAYLSDIQQFCGRKSEHYCMLWRWQNREAKANAVLDF